ncbi:hypothetical protein D3C76_1727410 [compost metagenome]
MFKIVAITEKATTNQIAIFVNVDQLGSKNPDLLSAIKANTLKIMIWIKQANRIGGGNFPGNFPPIAYSPHGTPKANAA